MIRVVAQRNLLLLAVENQHELFSRPVAHSELVVLWPLSNRPTHLLVVHKMLSQTFLCTRFCWMSIAVAIFIDKEGGGASPVETTEPRLQPVCPEASRSLFAGSLLSNGAPSSVSYLSISAVNLRILFTVDSFEESSSGCKWNQNRPVPSKGHIMNTTPEGRGAHCLGCGSWCKCGSLLVKFKLNACKAGVGCGCTGTPHESLVRFVGDTLASGAGI